MRPLFSEKERKFCSLVSGLMLCNPFIARRDELQRGILTIDFSRSLKPSNTKLLTGGKLSPPELMDERLEYVTVKLRKRLPASNASDRDLALYEDTAIYFLYHRYFNKFHEFIEQSVNEGRGAGVVKFFEDFQRDAKYFLEIEGVELPKSHNNIPHLFACCFQIRRAFHYIFRIIAGRSGAARKFRADVWQSIFTHDMRRYANHHYKIMGDMTTLIMGPSGTGKELVARAVGMARYIPFDEETKRFAEDFTFLFHPLNVSALSPTIIESELFGHKKGAFTGAIQDKAGWLEICSPLGAIFLDEIGDIDPSIQAKLLRLLQERTFQRIGETKTRSFRGKIVAATNRNLAEEMDKGRFRKDLYYRLCSDIIQTPSLHEQVAESPGELYNLILFISKRLLGDKDEGELLAKNVEEWIRKEVGSAYNWPGNIRELEQCIRSIMIRNEYHPQMHQESGEFIFADELAYGPLTADELLQQYCTLVYSKTGSYQETARRLGLDRRTVKSRTDIYLLEKLKKNNPGKASIKYPNSELA